MVSQGRTREAFGAHLLTARIRVAKKYDEAGEHGEAEIFYRRALVVTPEAVDVVWTSQNYHDMHNKQYAMDVNEVNKAIYKSLKPGGYYVIIDHKAAETAGDDVPRYPPTIIADKTVGLTFAFATLSALMHRQRTGEGDRKSVV